VLVAVLVAVLVTALVSVLLSNEARYDATGALSRPAADRRARPKARRRTARS
jgi:di/tricarboxylate transporter